MKISCMCTFKNYTVQFRQKRRGGGSRRRIHLDSPSKRSPTHNFSRHERGERTQFQNLQQSRDPGSTPPPSPRCREKPLTGGKDQYWRIIEITFHPWNGQTSYYCVSVQDRHGTLVMYCKLLTQSNVVRSIFSCGTSPYCLRTVVVYSPVYSVYTAPCTHNRPLLLQYSPRSAPSDILFHLSGSFE
jgi:hypothetical protein